MGRPRGMRDGRAGAVTEAVAVRAMTGRASFLRSWASRGSPSAGAPMAQHPLALTNHTGREVQGMIQLNKQVRAVTKQGRACINQELDAN